MKVKGELLEIKYPIDYGPDYLMIRHLVYDQVTWAMTLDELVELSSLTEALLQELKGEQE